MRSIERRCLERLLEAVHVDQDVWSAAGLRDKTADIARYFDRPPFTGLRVVTTSNVGSTESDEAS